MKWCIASMWRHRFVDARFSVTAIAAALSLCIFVAWSGLFCADSLASFHSHIVSCVAWTASIYSASHVFIVTAGWFFCSIEWVLKIVCEWGLLWIYSLSIPPCRHPSEWSEVLLFAHNKGYIVILSIYGILVHVWAVLLIVWYGCCCDMKVLRLQMLCPDGCCQKYIAVRCWLMENFILSSESSGGNLLTVIKLGVAWKLWWLFIGVMWFIKLKKLLYHSGLRYMDVRWVSTSDIPPQQGNRDVQVFEFIFM